METSKLQRSKASNWKPASVM